MKTRKNLAITYIKIILVIAIIAVGVYFGIKAISKEYNNEEYETIKTDMLLIQGKTEVIAQRVEIEEEGVEYIGTEIKEKQDDAKIQNLINNNVINLESEDNNYYCIDNANLQELGLSDVSIDDYYIVDYTQNDVIYVDGIQDEAGNTVYKLSDMEWYWKRITILAVSNYI